MGERYYDRGQAPHHYPSQQGQQHYGASNSSLDRGYQPPAQYHPPNPGQYGSSSNMHLAPYEGDYRHPVSSNSGESRRHSHHHSRSRSRHSRHSRKGSRSRRSSPSDDERSRSRVREYTDKIKDHKKEIGASLLGAAAGGAIGQKLGGGGIGTILGVAAGAFAGDKLEKHHERRKSGRKSRDDDDDLAYGSKYGASQRDLASSDSDDERRRHRHHHHHRRSRSRRGRGGDSD